MKFRRKLIITYTAFMLAVSVVVGIGYQGYSMRQYQNNEYKNMEILARHMIQNADFTLQSMEDVMSYFLSDMEVLGAINTLSNTAAGDQGRLSYREEARNIVRSKLNTDYIINRFYRVIFFNQAGDVIASNDDGSMLVDSRKSLEGYPWLRQVEGTRGKPVLIPDHEDYWGLKQNPHVFSLVKEIQGPHLGFLEIQKKDEDLEVLFKVEKQGMDVVVFHDGDIFYSSREDVPEGFYSGVRDASGNKIQEAENPKTGKKEVIFDYTSEENGLTILAVEEKEKIMENLPAILPVTVLVSGCFFLASIFIIIILSNRLTRPLVQLKETMERTQTDNLADELVTDDVTDEIMAVNQAYQNLIARLKESMVREKRLSLLQLQAQFDLLQTQINPHFLYNVLNILADRGVENEDDMTCEICGSLASMLRYSLNTKERYATVADELSYLNQYFFLLKCRYEHKLEYTIEVEEAVMKVIIPKITLQQFVENAVTHGYENTAEIKKIEVRGWMENGIWYLMVRDGGTGFGQDVIRGTEQKIGKIRNQLTRNRNNLEAEIGGLGLVNTYARLYLIYGDELIFKIKDLEKGAEVLIGGDSSDSEQSMPSTQ